MKKSVLMALILCVALLTWGCGGQPASEEPKRQEQTQKEENTAVETTLGAGEWYVGEDIPPGRYVISSQDGGNIAIYDDENSSSDVNEILDPDGDVGVQTLTYTLKHNQIIKISNANTVLFTPKED